MGIVSIGFTDKNMLYPVYSGFFSLVRTFTPHLFKENNRYKEIPFLYLIASYSRNEAMDWAIKNFSYEGKIKKGAWIIYKFKS